jgi:biofilm protein TabA
MILDALGNAKRYSTVHPLFLRAFDFLMSPGLDALGPGRVEIAGPDLTATISTQQGKLQSEARLETHKKFIDIHYLIAGRETAGWRAAAECRLIDTAYNPEKDYAMFADEPVLWVSMLPGTFVVFFPWDGHAPLVGEGNIHKVVIKVAV